MSSRGYITASILQENLTSVAETLKFIEESIEDHPLQQNFKPEDITAGYNISEGGQPEYYRNITMDFVGDGFFVCPVR